MPHELVQKHVYSEVFQDNVSPQLLLILDWIYMLLDYFLNWKLFD